jgi:hypothetical protein
LWDHVVPRTRPTQTAIVAGKKTPKSSVAIAQEKLGPAR